MQCHRKTGSVLGVKYVAAMHVYMIMVGFVCYSYAIFLLPYTHKQKKINIYIYKKCNKSHDYNCATR